MCRHFLAFLNRFCESDCTKGAVEHSPIFPIFKSTLWKAFKWPARAVECRVVWHCTTLHCSGRLRRGGGGEVQRDLSCTTWTFKFHSRLDFSYACLLKRKSIGKSNKSWEPDYLKSSPGRYCGLFKSNNWLPSTAVWWIAASGWYFGQIWPAALYLTLGAKAVCPAGGRWCIALILNVTRLAARSLRVALFLGEKCGLEVVVCWVGQLHQQVIIISYHLLKCSQSLRPQQHR